MAADTENAGSRPAEPSNPAPKRRTFLRKPKSDAFVAPAGGFIPVFLILLLFLLAAVYVKPLFFGVLAAVLTFRLEQFLERRFFCTKPVRAIHAFCVKLNAPFAAFRRRITLRLNSAPVSDPSEPATPAETAPGAISLPERRKIAARASAVAVILVVVLTLFSAWAAVHFITPFASKSGETVSNWAQNNHLVEKLEQKVGELLDKIDPQPEEETGTNVRERLRDRLSTVMEEHNADVTKFTIRAGNELVKNAFHITAWAGTFAFDLVMFLFFYYYFLLKMAVFAAGREDSGQDLGEWTVSSIYETGWLPDVSETERAGAARIIDHIYGMFRAWLVGYFWIIVLETILYALIFVPFNVPFWPILALIAGSTILLPFLGPVLAALLSIGVTILFAQDGIVMPIIGVGLGYLLIHVILEQLLLYPVLVGEAIGLTLVETIIVVLLGAVVAGVSGMILAVPAAALLKLLVPLFYDAMRKRGLLRRNSNPPAGENPSP